MNKTKICSKCRKRKRIGAKGEFWRNKSTKDGWATWCRSCMKAQRDAHPEYEQRRRAREYGLTEVEYQAMVGKPCPICLNVDRRMVIDHDHQTGKVRGMICCQCNRALGLMGDTLEAVERACTYLSCANDA
jgi:hypothetical protein